MNTKEKCKICGYEFIPGDAGGALTFERREKDELWHQEAKEKDMIGEEEPPEVGWFCAKHYPKVKKHTDMAIDDAMALIKSKEE